MPEKIFKKYQIRGADYHWKQIDRKNLFHFNSFNYATYKILNNEIINLIKSAGINSDNPRILDFGCGDGVQLFLLEKSLKKILPKVSIYGVDSSSDSIRVARKKNSEGQFDCKSVYSTGFPNNYFEVAISSDVIEHVEYPEIMVDEMVRVTKNSGFIAIGTPIRYSEFPQDNMHSKEFFQEEFKNLFKREGLELIKYIESHGLLYSLLYKKRLNLFGKKIGFFRYLINLLDIIFRKSVFIKTKDKNSKELMCYQIIILRKI